MSSSPDRGSETELEVKAEDVSVEGSPAMAGQVSLFVVGPEKRAWASPSDGAGDSGPAAAPAVASVERPAPARALLRLLQVAALTGGGRWQDLLYALLIHGLYTAAAGVSIVMLAKQSIQQLTEGVMVIEVVAHTGYMGVIAGLMWAPLACCFAAGRRQYGQVLLSSERVLRRVAALPAYQEPARKHHRQVVYLLTAVAVSTLYVAVVFFYYQLPDSACDGLSQDYAIFICSFGLLIAFYGGAHLIPVKFTLVGLEVISGYRAIGGELRDACHEKRQTNGTMLRKLRAIHIELSQTFASLTDTMSLELITVMCYGTLSSISIWLLLIIGIRQGAAVLAAAAPNVVLYVLGAAISVVLPCEVAQRALNAVRQTHELLLKPQWQLPQLQQELRLFRETARRDLDTLGDLGLFRLQRSTILSIMATVITYIIVMVQFYMTELNTTAPAQ